MPSPPTAPDSPTDEALLTQVAAGDEAAFGLLFDRFSPRLFGLLRQMLSDEKEAEDVLQEGFVYLWEKAASFDETRGKAFTWAVMIVRNKAIDGMRARGRRQKLSERAAEELPQLLDLEVPSADCSTETKERSQMVRSAVQALPTEQRRMIEFAFLGGFTHQAIAQRLGLPLGTVKTNIRRGLCRLRDVLKGVRE